MDGQNYLKSLHKMQIDRERLKLAVCSVPGRKVKSHGDTPFIPSGRRPFKQTKNHSTFVLFQGMTKVAGIQIVSSFLMEKLFHIFQYIHH